MGFITVMAMGMANPGSWNSVWMGGEEIELAPKARGFQENNLCPDLFGSVDRASACRLKGPRFNSYQGPVPWL